MSKCSGRKRTTRPDGNSTTDCQTSWRCGSTRHSQVYVGSILNRLSCSCIVHCVTNRAGRQCGDGACASDVKCCTGSLGECRCSCSSQGRAYCQCSGIG